MTHAFAPSGVWRFRYFQFFVENLEQSNGVVAAPRLAHTRPAAGVLFLEKTVQDLVHQAAAVDGGHHITVVRFLHDVEPEN